MLYLINFKTSNNPLYLINVGLRNKTPKEPSEASAAHQERQKTTSTIPLNQAVGNTSALLTVSLSTALLTTPSPSQDRLPLRPVQQLFKCTFNYNHTPSPDLINTDKLG